MTRPTIPTDGLGRIAQLTIAALAVLAVVTGPAAAATPADASADATIDEPVTGDYCTWACVGALDRPVVYGDDEEGGWRVAVKKFENTAY